MAKPQARKPSSEDLSRFTTTVKAGEFIYREGDLTSDLYILEDGRVELLRQEDGVHRVVATLGSGEPFGELGLLEDAPRDASARAQSDCSLLKLDYSTLIEVIRENPQVALHALRRLSKRLREQEIAVLAAASHPVVPARTNSGAASTAAEAFGLPPSEPVVAAVVRKLVSPRLVHLKSGVFFPFATDEAVIGRGDKTHGTVVEIDLTDLDRQRTTSRRHAVVFMRGEEAFVREEPGVSNGTFVNGRRVKSGTEVSLQEGDRVRFGLVELVVRGNE